MEQMCLGKALFIGQGRRALHSSLILKIGTMMITVLLTLTVLERYALWQPLENVLKFQADYQAGGVDSLVHSTLFFVKTCSLYEKRAQVLYHSWGVHVENIIFSTDRLLLGIPAELQRVQPFSSSRAKTFMLSAPVNMSSHAASCAVTLLNLRNVLLERVWRNIKWLMVVDDDTFVVRDNLLSYLKQFDVREDYYLALSNEEPLFWYNRSKLSPFMSVAASAPGLAYSHSLLSKIRSAHAHLLNFQAVLRRCQNAQFGDDVALGLLARVDFNAPVLPRPDLRAFHWKELSPPKYIQPLTIHTQQQFVSAGLSVMEVLGEKYYGMERKKKSTD